MEQAHHLYNIGSIGTIEKESVMQAAEMVLTEEEYDKYIGNDNLIFEVLMRV